VVKGSRDREPVGDDLEVIELAADEGTTPRRGPSVKSMTRMGRRARRGLFLLAIAAAVVAGAWVVVSLDEGDSQSEPGRRGMSNSSSTVRSVVPGSTVIPLEDRPPVTSPGDGSTTAPLLPEGAPSTPHAGELVASVANPPDGLYYLYADGRLIWSPRQAEVWGGMVEQRLTREGVERVRSEFLAAGRFSPDPPLLGSDAECPGGGACVRGDDGRLLMLLGPGSPVSPASHVSPAPARLVSYLRTLDSSLPKTEWATPRVRPYVASRFNVCLGTYANLPDRAIPVQIDLATVLPALPPAAEWLFGSREAHGDGVEGSCSHLFETTLEEARALADVFLSSTGGGTHEYSGIVIRNAELATIQSDVSEGIVVYVSFQPLLPNGTQAGAPVG